MRSSVLIKPRSSNVLRIRVRRQRESGGGQRKQMLEESILLQESIRLRAESGQEQFKHSSNNRAGGTPSSRYASLLMGASVSGAIEKSSLAANRTARSMRTGSSRYRRLRIADQFQPARPYVADPIDEIPNREILDVVVKTVGREITPPHVLFDGAVDVVAQDSSPLIKGTCSESFGAVNSASTSGSAAGSVTPSSFTESGSASSVSSRSGAAAARTSQPR